jgi:aminoglycoside phosphotransferase family enzyme
VRAKIALFTASDPAVDEKTTAACIEQAKKHFLLAEQYAKA